MPEPEISAPAHREPPRYASASGRLLGRLAKGERGTAVVEFALVAPLLFLLVLGILDFGRMLDYYNTLTQVAGEGARAAAVNRNPDGTALSNSNLYSIQQQLATTYTTQPELNDNPNNPNHVVVCITQVPQSEGQPVTVRASYVFNFIPLVGAAVGHLAGFTISATQTERAEIAPVDVNGQPTYAAGNQDGNKNVGC